MDKINERIVSLKEKHILGHIEISDIIQKEFNVKLSPKAVRNRYYRKKIKTQERKLHHIPAKVEGTSTEYRVNISDVWEKIETHEKNGFLPNLFASRKKILLPNEPIALACLSDLHVGNSGTYYSALREDVDIINKTEGMYVGIFGDFLDNWIF